jgi:uncharacterized membrane protein
MHLCFILFPDGININTLIEYNFYVLGFIVGLMKMLVLVGYLHQEIVLRQICNSVGKGNA